MAAQLNIHPAADLFPMIEGEQLDELTASIKAHGLRERIKLTPDGQVLDGRNRLAALKAARIKFDRDEHAEIIDLISAGMTAGEYVLDANIRRRHLTTAQRRTLAGKLYLQITAEQSDKPKAEQVDAAQVAATATGTSKATAKRAAREERAKSGMVTKKAAEQKRRKADAPAPAAPEAPAAVEETPSSASDDLRSLKELQTRLAAPQTKLTKTQRDRLLAVAEDVVARLTGWQFD